MKALIDINIIMDFLCHRDDFFDNANAIIKKCLSKELTGIIAAHTVTTIFYLLRKDVPNTSNRCAILLNICKIFEISAVNKEILIRALNDNSFSDFEDSVQNSCAVDSNADCIITRNKEYFATSKITLYSPEEFLKEFEAR